MKYLLTIALASCALVVAQVRTLTPVEQQQVDAQMRPAQLDEAARVEVSLEGATLTEVMAAISLQSGLMVRTDTKVPELEQRRTVKLKNASLKEALAAVLDANGLAWIAAGQKSIFVYSNTPPNRQKFTESIRNFPVVKIDTGRLLLQIVQSDILRPEGLRPMIIASPASRILTVRATADKMAEVERFIAANDKH